MFPSVDELRSKFRETKYVVDEVTIRQVYGFTRITCIAPARRKYLKLAPARPKAEKNSEEALPPSDAS